MKNQRSHVADGSIPFTKMINDPEYNEADLTITVVMVALGCVCIYQLIYCLTH